MPAAAGASMPLTPPVSPSEGYAARVRSRRRNAWIRTTHTPTMHQPQRRTLAAALALTPVLALARPHRLTAETAWLLGSWQSDVERSMEHWTFQGQAPRADLRPRVAALFGKIVHTCTPTHVHVDTVFGEGINHRDTLHYRVVRHTSSTVTLAFSGSERTDMTFYRGNGYYFIRVGSNCEYFKKIST